MKVKDGVGQGLGAVGVLRGDPRTHGQGNHVELLHGLVVYRSYWLPSSTHGVFPFKTNNLTIISYFEFSLE